MKIAVLLWPHANVRYFESMKGLAKLELTVLLGAQGERGEIASTTRNGLPFLEFESKMDSERLQKLLSFFSAGYAFFEAKGEALYPLMPGNELVMGKELSALLKYKGKTNEMFTGMLVNLAVSSSGFAKKFDQPLTVLDPMCGRGTGLFEALRRGYDAAGIEIDKTDVGQINQFFKKYMELGHYKYKAERKSLTVAGANPGWLTEYSFAPNAEQMKARPSRLQVVHGDTISAPSFFKKQRFHALVADLPYGIFHESRDGKEKRALDQVMQKALLGWRKIMLPGGGLALSFNAYTLPLEEARSMVEEAGFTVLRGGEYDQFAHWVEQAIMRDVVLAVNET